MLKQRVLGDGVQSKISRRWLEDMRITVHVCTGWLLWYMIYINDLNNRANVLSPLSSPAYTAAPHLSQMNVFISNVPIEGDSQVNNHTKECLHCFQSAAMRCVSTPELQRESLSLLGVKNEAKGLWSVSQCKTKLALRLKPNYVSVNLHDSDSRKITGLFHQSGEERYITENWVTNELRPWLLHSVCDEENKAKRSYSNYKVWSFYLDQSLPTMVGRDYCESTLFSCVVNLESLLVLLSVSQMKALFLEALSLGVVAWQTTASVAGDCKI